MRLLERLSEAALMHRWSYVALGTRQRYPACSDVRPRECDLPRQGASPRAELSSYPPVGPPRRPVPSPRPSQYRAPFAPIQAHAFGVAQWLHWTRTAGTHERRPVPATTVQHHRVTLGSVAGGLQTGCRRGSEESLGGDKTPASTPEEGWHPRAVPCAPSARSTYISDATEDISFALGDGRGYLELRRQ